MSTTEQTLAVVNADVPPPANSAVALIREAMASKADPAYLKELLAVRRDWEADEARKSYSAAVAEFQGRCPIIEKADEAHNKKYARMDRIWRETRPLRAELGLAATWQACELRDNGLCHIEGQLRHRDGHSERLCMDVPLPELIKGQNVAQQMGSAYTYAQRYAVCAALGIVTGEDDDDGNGAGAKFITPEQAHIIADKISACEGIASFSRDAFWRWVGGGAVIPQQIPANRFGDVVAMLDRKLKGGAS
jgi:hypothetical protein